MNKLYKLNETKGVIHDSLFNEVSTTSDLIRFKNSLWNEFGSLLESEIPDYIDGLTNQLNNPYTDNDSYKILKGFRDCLIFQYVSVNS